MGHSLMFFQFPLALHPRSAARLHPWTLLPRNPTNMDGPGSSPLALRAVIDLEIEQCSHKHSNSAPGSI